MYSNKDIPRYLNLFNVSIWGIEGLVSERYNLKNINAARSSMQSGKSVEGSNKFMNVPIFTVDECPIYNDCVHYGHFNSVHPDTG